MRIEDQKALIAAQNLDGRKMWDKRPDETGLAYDTFLLFKEMGPTRSMAKMTELTGKQRLVIRRWRIKYDWDLRVAAWDAKINIAREDAAIAEAKRMGERQAQLGMRLQQVGGDRLEQFATVPELQAILTPSDTLRFIKEGAELERTARGDDPDKGRSGNITFNFNMGMPKWAPKQIQETVVEVVQVVEGVIGGDKSKEATD